MSKSQIVKGEVFILCYLVERGAKSAAVTTIYVDAIESTLIYINTNHPKLKVIEEKVSNDISNLWIYKLPHTAKVIDFILSRRKPITNDYINDWMMGKLFGYSDTAIEAFFNGVDGGVD